MSLVAILFLLLGIAVFYLAAFIGHACVAASSRAPRPPACSCGRRVAVMLPEHLGGDKVATLCPDCDRQVYCAAYIYGPPVSAHKRTSQHD